MNRRLWLGLTAAPAAWIAQGLFGWWVGARICTSLSVARVRVAAGVFSVAMLLAALWGLSLAWHAWRDATTMTRPPGDRVEFMAVGGGFVSVSFLVAIAWAALTPVFIDVCGGMR